MIRRPPSSTRTDTLCPYTTLFRSDFYVVRRGWIEDVLNHMTANRLAIFGAPWHPFWFNKFRGFPCAHFMAIDRSRVAVRPEDVIPLLLFDQRLPNDPVLRAWADRKSTRLNSSH